MPSQYPVLDNKPIDQWRVAELREELRRRKLVTKGLKEELVRRLDEAIQKEMESDNGEDLGNEIEHEIELNSDLPNNAIEEDVETEIADDTQPLSDDNNHTNKDGAILDSGAVVLDVDQGTEDQTGDALEDAGLAGTDEEKRAAANNLEDSAPGNQNVIIKSGTCAEVAEHAEKYEDEEPPIEDSVVFQSEQSHQVSEVSQDLGFQVKFESNCTDSVSINEKNNIKDNLTADNFHLELKVKQEVVLSSSSSYPSDGGDTCMVDVEQEADKSHVTDEQEDKSHATDEQEDKSHATDEQEEDKSHVTNEQEDKNQASDGEQEGQNLLSVEQEATNSNVAIEQVVAETHFEQEVGQAQAYVDDADLQNATNAAAPSRKEDNIDVASPEKLNLDRSSGDESMEEDMLESKHMEADTKSEELTDKTKANKVDVALEGRAAADAVSQFSHEMKDIAVGHLKPTSPTEKRKLEDEAVGSNNVPKRQRRWNPDTINVPDQQAPHVIISTTPKNSAQQTLRGTFSRSTLSADSPKERIVPTSKKPATISLRIDNFLRPFTLKAVQELLAKTGKVCDFWMDHIKTHCYVTYSSVEEATETRNAIYNLQWPPNGGRLLAAEYVDPQEVKVRSVAPPQSPATPVSPILATPKAPTPEETQAPQPSRQQNLRQQPLPPPPPLAPPPPPMLSNPPPIARERLPPPPKKPEPPVVTLDDLFKKTKATPRIYYLPLTEDQVAAKLAAKGKSTKV